MERILVGIDILRPSPEPLVRALCLGPRIGARVSVLVVLPPGQAAAGRTECLRGIESEIEAAKLSGANVELLVAEGRYEQELISAARQLKTTVLVASAGGSDEQGGEREAERLGRILGGVACRVELVSTKKHREPEKDRT